MYFLHRMNFFAPQRTLPVDRQRERKTFQRPKNINEIGKAQGHKKKKRKKETISSHTLRTRFLECPPGLAP